MKLGDLSAKYESNGDPGAISSGENDAGGVSYGAYQFASKPGIPADFVAWLIRQGYPYAQILADGGAPGSRQFSAAWLWVATQDPDGFITMQHDFVSEMYYDPAKIKAAEAHIDLDQRSEALRQVVWSASVQYGSYYIYELFEDAAELLGQPNASYATDAQLIPAIYEVRASDDWTAGSPDLRPALIARFEAECQDALAMLEEE